MRRILITSLALCTAALSAACFKRGIPDSARVVASLNASIRRPKSARLLRKISSRLFNSKAKIIVGISSRMTMMLTNNSTDIGFNPFGV